MKSFVAAFHFQECSSGCFSIQILIFVQINQVVNHLKNEPSGGYKCWEWSKMRCCEFLLLSGAWSFTPPVGNLWSGWCWKLSLVENESVLYLHTEMTKGSQRSMTGRSGNFATSQIWMTGANRLEGGNVWLEVKEPVWPSSTHNPYLCWLLFLSWHFLCRTFSVLIKNNHLDLGGWERLGRGG